MTVYNITLETPNGIKEISCDGDTPILDAAEAHGLNLPSSCRAGACSTCTGKLVNNGNDSAIDLSNGSFLDESQLQRGFILLCICYPRGNLTIQTHMEEEL
ncbi:2Fe-2S iron-sulfur cluster-binding protein [Pseudoalteromonas espejiana]